MLPRQILVTSLLLSAAVASLLGCNRPVTHASPAATTGALGRQVQPVTPALRHACCVFPAGNAATRHFLAQAAQRHPHYCTMELDAQENCIRIGLHPCYSAQDDDLKFIAQLTLVETVGLNGPQVSDAGLRELESMPNLRTLSMISARRVSDGGLAQLKAHNPALAIDLPYREP